MRHPINSFFLKWAGCLLFLVQPIFGESDLVIPAKEFSQLQKSIEKAAKTDRRSSSSRVAYKRVVRNAKKLLEEFPDAENRFEVLKIMFKNQLVVLDMEQNDRNKKSLYEICLQLTEATDEWADVRLEADLVLLEFRLAEKDASEEQHVQALSELLQRYEGGPAEINSLMLTAMTASKLGYQHLVRAIEIKMDAKYGDVPKVIAFRRNVLSLKTLSVKCRGYYKRSDGVMLHIPGDRIGHQCLFVYWSQDNPKSEKFLSEVEAQRKQFLGQFEVYSFNLDGLPDAGKSYLEEKGMDWQAMHLPGGKENLYFRAYGGGDPMALFVSPFGYTVLNPFSQNVDGRVGVHGVHGGTFKVSETRLSHERYLAQLQSVLVGEFLINDSKSEFNPNLPPELMHLREGALDLKLDEDLKADLREINGCFILPPFRYRLSRADSLLMYKQADDLCQKALKNHSKKESLWLVRNRRVVALLGRWNLEADTAYLNAAVEEAKQILDEDLPWSAQVVARFCLARNDLRGEYDSAAQILAKVVEDLGAELCPASGLAMVSILALEANDRQLHESYRQRFLDHEVSSLMLGVKNFFNSRFQRFQLFRPNTTRGDRMFATRGYIVKHEWNPDAPVLPKTAFKDLDGETFILPDANEGKLTLLLFIEPPEDPNADFPIQLDRNGKPTKNDAIRKVVSDATLMAKTHLNQSVEVVLAFLSDDPERVRELMEKNDWSHKAVLVAGGLRDPIVNELAIVSADRVPNVFLLRRDGRIAWHTEGLQYKKEFGYPFALLLAMKVHIEVADVEYGYRALERGEYERAVKIFEGPFAPTNPDRYGWRSPRHHGRTLALMALGRWKEAIEAAEIAIDAHKRRHYRYPGRLRNVADWRQGMSTVEIKESCNIFSELWRLKSIALAKLGEEEASQKFREKADAPHREDHENIYGSFQKRLKAMRESGSLFSIEK